MRAQGSLSGGRATFIRPQSGVGLALALLPCLLQAGPPPAADPGAPTGLLRGSLSIPPSSHITPVASAPPVLHTLELISDLKLCLPPRLLWVPGGPPPSLSWGLWSCGSPSLGVCGGPVTCLKPRGHSEGDGVCVITERKTETVF